MGKLTQDMRRLAADVERVRQLRTGTVDRLRQGEKERQRAAAEATERRRQQVAELRANVRRSLAENRERLSGTTARLRQDLQDFSTDLRQGVETLRADLRQDLAGARQAWHGTADVATPSAPAPAAHQDDLTALSGIGPGMQERLYRAGIDTYRRLVETPIEQIHRALGELSRLAHVDQWIEEASQRLGGDRK